MTAPITGPSSTSEPVITTSPLTAATSRTFIQGGIGAFIVQGIEEFNPDLLTDGQVVWAAAAITAAVAFVQNLIEKWRGRRLIGAST